MCRMAHHGPWPWPVADMCRILSGHVHVMNEPDVSPWKGTVFWGRCERCCRSKMWHLLNNCMTVMEGFKFLELTLYNKPVRPVHVCAAGAVHLQQPPSRRIWSMPAGYANPTSSLTTRFSCTIYLQHMPNAITPAVQERLQLKTHLSGSTWHRCLHGNF